MSVAIAALVSWLVTAVFGGVLLYLWAARVARSATSRVSYGRPPPYIPRQIVVAHVLMALGGLVAWVCAIVLVDELGWAALAALGIVALLGTSMFVRWLGSRRARRAARALSGAPPESRLPTLVVYGHGVLGVTTVLLVILSWFRPNGL